MIGVQTIGPSGPEFQLGSPDELGELRAGYDRRHCVRLRGFIAPELLEEIAAGIERAAYYERTHDGIGVEECMLPDTTLAQLLFAANDQALFHVVREITGCGRIGCFDGRVYRLHPASAHHDSWHSDMSDHRMVAMSVNVGARYQGGALQIRDQRSGQVAHEEPPVDPGDAILFRLDEGLRHQVTAVEGTAPRTAFAGWFKSQPTLLSVIRGGEWSAS